MYNTSYYRTIWNRFVSVANIFKGTRIFLRNAAAWIGRSLYLLFKIWIWSEKSCGRKKIVEQTINKMYFVNVFWYVSGSKMHSSYYVYLILYLDGLSTDNCHLYFFLLPSLFGHCEALWFMILYCISTIILWNILKIVKSQMMWTWRGINK